MAEKVKDYRDLLVWQKGIQLVKMVYALVAAFPKHETYALSDQLRRAVVSVPSNIAEGQSRLHKTEFRHHLHIALGSAAEVDTQIVIALELGYINNADAENVYVAIAEICRMIRGLITSLAI